MLRKKKGYTLIELLITMTIIAVMAIFGIIAFQGYGKSTMFDQSGTEIQSLLQQVNLLAKNPEKDALSYCIVAQSGKITLYKGLDEQCAKRVAKTELQLESGQVITNQAELVANHFLVCEQLGSNCYLKSDENSQNKIAITKKTFFFQLSDNGGRKSDFYLSLNPFIITKE